MAKIRKIEPVMPTLPTRKKVAAYARVSMETERLHHSLSAQVSYYSDLIQRNPEWEYAGVYADDGITGTKANSREEFQRMLEDCEAGKIDIILTKSISRFARNTVDLLETVRHLKELGVSVRFEKENIDSLSGDGEVMLTLLASFAQEEITSLSNNVKWGIRKRFEKGIPNFRNKILGYEWEGDHLVVVPEEAAIVKRIFQNFLDGKSRLETERELNGEGITTKAGCKWCDSNIKVVLSNITYTGNLLLQKEYIEDPITKKRRKNKGELPQYFVENTHGHGDLPICAGRDGQTPQARCPCQQEPEHLLLHRQDQMPLLRLQLHAPHPQTRERHRELLEVRHHQEEGWPLPGQRRHPGRQAEDGLRGRPRLRRV